jgi:hypothetical protein
MYGPTVILLLDISVTTKTTVCGLVVRVPVYRSRGPGSISGTTRVSEK